jgi:hypothetical protein
MLNTEKLETIYKNLNGAYVYVPEQIYWTESYSEAEVVTFAKIIVFYIAYWYEDDIVKPLHAKYEVWKELIGPLCKEVGITKEIKAIDALITKSPFKLVSKNLNAYSTALLALRTKIYKDKTSKNALFMRSAMPNNIKTLLTYAFSAINGIDSGAANLARNVPVLKEPLLNQYFVLETDNSNLKNLVKEYLSFIKNFTGKTSDGLDLEEINKLRAKPALMERYKELSKPITDILNKNMSNFIRSTGEQLVDADKIRDHLKELGIPYKQKIPEGFVGKYDAKFNMFLNDGRQIPTQVGGWMEMVKNPKPGSYVARGKGLMVSTEKTYVPLKETSKLKDEKFGKVAALLPNIKEYVVKWRKDFMLNTGKAKMLGAMAELMFITAGRIGSYAKAESDLPVYGISVLKGKHLKQQGSNLIIEYEGKGFHKAKGTNTKIKHVLKPTNDVQKELITYLEDLKAKAGNNGYIFQYDGKPIKETGLSAYLKSDVALPVSPHKFRHLRGSKMFTDFMALNPIKKNATLKEVTDTVKAILTEIGNKLGHLRTDKDGKTSATFATAAKSYVDPSLMRKVFVDRDLPVPSFVPTKTEEDEE